MSRFRCDHHPYLTLGDGWLIPDWRFLETVDRGTTDPAELDALADSLRAQLLASSRGDVMRWLLEALEIVDLLRAHQTTAALERLDQLPPLETDDLRGLGITTLTEGAHA